MSRQILIGLMILAINGCSPHASGKRSQKYTDSRYLMGTVVGIEVCFDKEKEIDLKSAAAELWERLEEINWRMNVFDEKSDVVKVNNSYQSPVLIGADTYRVIADSIHFNKLTHGAFDITVWPLIKFWKRSAKQNTLPTEAEIQEVKKALGSDKIALLSDHHVEVLHPETKIDLGGIAGGYAVDEAVRILREHGFLDFLIDEGGDLFLSGKNCEGKPWRIGIRHPRDPQEMMEVLELSNQAVTTSGDYEQLYEIQNQHWSHIMNPLTGYPPKSVVSATVIAPTTEEADALATALCVLSPRGGVDLIDSLGEGFACLLIEHAPDEHWVRHESQRYQTIKKWKGLGKDFR